MCGVVGVSSKYDSNNQIVLSNIHNLILESQIRGRHSTGVSFILDGKIKTIIEPLRASDFLKKHWEEIRSDLGDSDIYLIGHTRYCTSGFEYNQPIYDDYFSVCVNGVITQADPEKWYDLFHVKTYNRNDAVIVLDRVRNNLSPLDIKSSNHVSLAAMVLHKGGTIKAMRNDSRPLYYYNYDKTTYFASTVSIFQRAMGITPKFTHPNTEYLIRDGVTEIVDMRDNVNELQINYAK